MIKFSDIFIILMLTLLYFVVFGMRSNYVTYAPIKDIGGQGVNVSSSALSARLTAVAAFASNDTANSHLPEFKIFSEYPLPERFIAKTVEISSLADYIVLTEAGLQDKLLSYNNRKVVEAPKNENAGKDALEIFASTTTGRAAVSRAESKRRKDVKVLALPKKIVKADSKPDILTYPSIEKYVFASNKSYIYVSHSSGSDVILTIISATPFNDSVIIRYSVDNLTKNYFFIDSTQLIDNTGSPVISQKFGEDFASPGHKETIYLLAKPNSKNLRLKITSSGGSVKWLEIAFTLP